MADAMRLWAFSALLLSLPETMALRRGYPPAFAVSHPMSRRGALSSAALSLGLAVGGAPAIAVQDPSDTSRLVVGYRNIKSLLDNWDVQTTTKEGARDADVVRKALGLRSTSDPLFQLDKLLQKAVSKTDPDRIEEWIESTDSLSTHVNNANEFAYTSAFGVCPCRWYRSLFTSGIPSRFRPQTLST